MAAQHVLYVDRYGGAAEDIIMTAAVQFFSKDETLKTLKSTKKFPATSTEVFGLNTLQHLFKCFLSLQEISVNYFFKNIACNSYY